MKKIYQESQAEVEQIQSILNHIKSMKTVVGVSKGFDDINIDVFHSSLYLDNSADTTLRALIPIPHLYFKASSNQSFKHLEEQFAAEHVEIDDIYFDILAQYIRNLYDYYSKVHIFIPQGNEDNRYCSRISELLLDYFWDDPEDSFTIDYCTPDKEGMEYGAPLYYGEHEKDSLILVVNFISKSDILHSQSIPLTSWVPEYPSDCFNSAFFSFIKTDSQTKEDVEGLTLSGTNNAIDWKKECKEMVSSWEKPNDMPLYSLHTYRPKGTATTPEEEKIQQLVWDFKDSFNNVSAAHHRRVEDAVANDICEVVKNTFGVHSEKLTLICLPASTKANYDRRFKSFSEKLCSASGMKNGFDCVKYTKDGMPKHLGGMDSPIVEFDASKLSGSAVVLFDDIYTSGKTAALYRNVLEELGATVLGIMTIGRTKR